MESLQSLTQRHRTVQYSNLTSLNNSTVNSTVEDTCSPEYFINLFKNLADVIPDDGYYPFYRAKLEELGAARFVALANKARAGSETPQKLFCWMLKNPALVR